MRYTVEQAYLEGRRIPEGFTRQSVERHMSHAADPESLRLLVGLASSTGIAARLRQLEVAATAIMDAALQADQPDAKTALAALREARHVLHEMSALTESLESGHGGDGTERPDLDAAIAAKLGMDPRTKPSPATREPDGSPRAILGGGEGEA